MFSFSIPSPTLRLVGFGVEGFHAETGLAGSLLMGEQARKLVDYYA